MALDDIQFLKSKFGGTATLPTTPSPTKSYSTSVSPTGSVQNSISYLKNKFESPQPRAPKSIASPYQPQYESATAQTFFNLKADPLSLKADPKNTFKDMWGTIKGSLQQEGENIKSLFTAKTPEEKKGGQGEVLGKELKVLTGAAGVLFSPISALFEGAKDIPVLGSVSRIVTLPFAVAGDAGKDLGKGFVKALPISDEAKEHISSGVEEMFSLAAQFAIGGALGKAGIKAKNRPKLVEKYGEKDADLILNKAEEMAQEKQKLDTTPPPSKPSPNAPQAPTEAIKPISKDLQPLAKEAQKYKSAEEFVKGVADKEIEVPIEMIQPNISPLLRGKKPSMTKGAIEVGYINRPIEMGDTVGKLRLRDGNHRYYEAIERGDKTIKVKFTKESLLRDDGSMWLGGDSLTDFYNKAVGKTKPVSEMTRAELDAKYPQFKSKFPALPEEDYKPKLISSTEPKQVPNTRAQTLEKAAVEKKLTETLGELPTHEKMNMATQAEKALDLIEKNPEKALRIARGEANAPEGVLPESIYTALEIKAMKDGDVTLLRELSKSEIPTEAGQRMKALDSDDINSPVKIMRDIAKTREEMAEKRLKKSPKKAKAEVVKEFKDEIKKASKRQSWEEFLKETTCRV